MKRLVTLAGFLFISSFAFSQTHDHESEWCGTMPMMEQYFEANPEKRAQYEADQEALLNVKPRSQKSGHKTIIPVVIHVIHYNGEGNISDAQIADGMRILNEDFNKQNADTNTIRTVFQNLSVSMDIEFRLARIDPQGNCTNGIVRYNSYLAEGPANRNAPKFVSPQSQWDPFKYMNIWIVDDFNQPTLGGFAQFPGSGPTNTYGFMVVDDEWGSIGTATAGSFAGRAVPHEMGHCFNLLHPFQRSNGFPNGCGSLCQSTGDRVCDTPPQIGTLNNQCPTGSTCNNDATGGSAANPNPFTTNVPDMVENIMGYGIGCQVMMTPGQKSRMEAAFSFYPLLSSLTDTANATATGTSDNYVPPTCPPIAEVLSYDKFVCAGSSITFTEESYGGPRTTYSWSFPGGTPSVSNLAQPVITYNTAGTYDVVLRVSNAGGIDSLVLTDYVHVLGSNAYSAFGYTEGFENDSIFDNEWVSISRTAGENPETIWERAAFASKTGSGSAWLKNFSSVYVGGVDQLISPAIDMTDVLNPNITFEVSYRRRATSNNDQIRFSASTNCGETWNNILSVGLSFYAFDNSTQPNSDFAPTQGNQWETVTIPSQVISNNIRNSDRVRFMIEVVHGDGNNVFIDDFAISGQPVGLDQQFVEEVETLRIFPNPTESMFNLVYNASKAGQTNIALRNILGERVMDIYNGEMESQEYRFTVDGTGLSKGIYFLTIEGEEERITEKVIIK